MSASVTVSKLDAARRQLSVAIKLHFEEEDPLAIQALVYPAHEIICGILKNRGEKSIIYDSDTIKPEFRKEAAKLFRKPWNFIKHADIDPDGELNFIPTNAPMLIVAAIYGLKQLKLRFSTNENAFLVWWIINNPEHINIAPQSPYYGLFKSDELTPLQQLSKKDFLSKFLAIDRHTMGDSPNQPWQKT